MPAITKTSSQSGTIQRVNPLEDAGWDVRLRTRPASSIFHSASWARVLQGTYGYAPAYFTLIEGDQLQALLPIMEVSSWLTGKRGISLPFTDECEPLCADTAS